MGYACPVCGTEEADGVHLANHFAVTASLGREDHLEWLETYAPNWNERGPDELAEIVTEHASEVETPEIKQGTDHGQSPSLEAELAAQSRQPGRGSTTQEPSPEAQGALEEARELTRKLYESSDGSEGTSDDDPSAESSDRELSETATESDNETL
ncbi:DUF5810 domain-containing protein [Halostagnicola sp. A-GB9-2]|uniref:DUF5810 domain-containing protein n=1 Tax=Halostagnicola sp. A-GB9-2 TaxID=3048066 RepID=UPI0024C01B78|nr:DUF5810 domain-containing protein [Halostagnicola sp. A-GB9-2]MDJ1432078.1 DUF5810 domain-containing protein [Halostagnicola sp. A-GB9-2]